MGYGRMKTGKEITGSTRDAGGYTRTPAPRGKVRSDMDPKAKKPKPGFGIKPILKIRVPVKPAPKPGFGISPPKKRGMGR
jgi:hypothetical protein